MRPLDSHLETAAVAVGIAVLAACGTSTGEPPQRPEPGRPPTFVAPDLYLCPEPYLPGYRSDRKGRVVFPLLHPQRPSLQVRPSRCFRSLEQAHRAGYRVAGPPPGFVAIDGLYLHRPPASVSRACEAAAAKLGLPTPCPALVPTGATWTCKPCVTDAFFALDLGASGPPGYVGVDGQPVIHLVIAAARDPSVPAVSCFGGEPLGASAVRGRRARLIRCPEGSERHSGHLLLRWTQEGTTYAVSLHGWNALNRKLAAVIADHMILRRP